MENKYEVRDNTGTLWLELQKKVGQNGEYEVMTGNERVKMSVHCPSPSCDYSRKGFHATGDFWLNGYPKQTSTGKNLLSLTLKQKPVKPPEETTRPMTQSDFARIENEQVGNVDLTQPPF